MIKKILIILLATFSINVYADECAPRDFEQAQVDLASASYTLEYANDYVDMYGNSEESFIKLKTLSLPSGYIMVIYADNGYYELRTFEDYVDLRGGVYKVEYYKETCDTPLKSMEIRIPHYKEYCGVNVDCKENAWFDGTYENTATNQITPNKSKVSTILVIILILLIIIIVIFIGLTIKRRKDREKAI